MMSPKKNRVCPFLQNRETRKTKTPLFALWVGYFKLLITYESPCVFIVFLIFTKLEDKGSNKTFTKKTFPVFFSLGIFK